MPLGLSLLSLTWVSGVAETWEVNPQAAEINMKCGRPTWPQSLGLLSAGQCLSQSRKGYEAVVSREPASNERAFL